MKKILTLGLLLTAFSVCSDSNLMSFKQKTTLSIANRSIDLEFYNMDYKYIDKMCLSDAITAFEDMIENHRYHMKKHIPMWRTEDFTPGKEPWDNKMILIKESIKKYYLLTIRITNSKELRRDYPFVQNPPWFMGLDKKPPRMKKGEILHGQGDPKEGIDFEACFK